MGQLPNLGKEYHLFDFNETTGALRVYFIQPRVHVVIAVPIENDMYVEGVTLDNFIMSWKPITKPPKHYKKNIKNTEYIKSLVTPNSKVPDSTKDKIDAIRQRREVALSSSDWTQLPDVQAVMPIEEQQMWKKFRQQLRDITTQPGYPDNVEWPQRPYMMGLIIYE